MNVWAIHSFQDWILGLQNKTGMLATLGIRDTAFLHSGLRPGVRVPEKYRYRTQYLGHSSKKQLFVVYLKWKCKWAAYIYLFAKSGNPSTQQVVAGQPTLLLSVSAKGNWSQAGSPKSSAYCTLALKELSQISQSHRGALNTTQTPGAFPAFLI